MKKNNNNKLTIALISIIGIIFLYAIIHIIIILQPAKIKYINNDKSINRTKISEYLEIELTKEADIVGQDLHDKFKNEGYTILKIKDRDLLEKINNSSNWRSNNDENTSHIKQIINTMKEYYPDINKTTNYKWLYKKGYVSDNPQYIDEIDPKTIMMSGIFLSIYDIDNDILYYYHYDI